MLIQAHARKSQQEVKPRGALKIHPQRKQLLFMERSRLVDAEQFIAESLWLGVQGDPALSVAVAAAAEAGERNDFVSNKYSHVLNACSIGLYTGNTHE
jgi:hypothetical protein